MPYAVARPPYVRRNIGCSKGVFAWCYVIILCKYVWFKKILIYKQYTTVHSNNIHVIIAVLE